MMYLDSPQSLSQYGLVDDMLHKSEKVCARAFYVCTTHIHSVCACVCFVLGGEAMEPEDVAP